MLAALSASAELRLDFPVPSANGNNYNAYTAPISAVLDHELPATATNFYCSQKLCHDAAAGCSLTWGVVGAYTGELANVDSGTVVTPSASCGGFPEPRNASGKGFIVNGAYTNADVTTLSYDGHPGYDYPFAKGTPIHAPADGRLYKVDSDPINGQTGCGGGTAWGKWHAFRIEHVDGFETWYLHVDSLATKFANLVPGGPGRDVLRNEVVAYVGDWHCGPDNIGDHLHFEVRRSVGSHLDAVVLDPYGWEWVPDLDPFERNVGRARGRLGPLWNVVVPRITSVSVTPLGDGFEAAVSGTGFSEKVYLTLWHKAGRYFCGATSLIPSQSAGTHVIASLPELTCGGSLADYYLKIRNQQGPRSKPVNLVSTGVATAVLPLGSPAPGGGTIVSYVSGVDDGTSALSDLGELHAVVGVDTDGDAIPDEERGIKHENGALAGVAFPSTTEPAWVRIGEWGHKAWGDGVNPQTTIYVEALPNGSPVIAAQAGQTDLQTGHTYADLRGPLAVSSTGRVAFQTSLYDGSGFLCCYLMVYDPVSGGRWHVAGDGASTPAGGTFALSSGYPRPGFTEHGDLVFGARITGGSRSWGIFRFTPPAGLSTILVDGDSGPLGSYDLTNINLRLSVSGNMIAFASTISGGAEAIFLVDLSNPSGAEVVAQAGQPTGTSVAGEFSVNGSPDWPFQDAPILRSDQSVVFRAHVWNSPATPVEPLRALFHWNRRETRKLFMEGETLGGTTINVLGPFEANNSGTVVFLGIQ